MTATLNTVPLLNRLFEPERLLLTWKAWEGVDRFAVAELRRSLAQPDQASFRYLLGTSDYELAIAAGFDGYPAFPELDKTYEHNCLPVFTRRLPPSKRGDYPRYLQDFLIAPEAHFSQFALLAHTQGKLVTDPWQLMGDVSSAQSGDTLFLEIAGFRFQNLPADFTPSVGAALDFQIIHDHPEDPGAIACFHQGTRIGWVRHVQKESFTQLMSRHLLRGELCKFNGSPEQPRLHMFVHIH